MTFSGVVEQAKGPAVGAARGGGVAVEGFLEGEEGGYEGVRAGEGGEHREEGGGYGVEVVLEEGVGVGV